MEERTMSKTKIEPKNYTEWELNEYAERFTIAAHNALAQEERRVGKRCFETFGEWKQNNPTHSMAKKNYPKDEYLAVISAHKNYFDKVYDDDELL